MSWKRTWNSAAHAPPRRWLGEIEGIDHTLSCLRAKRADAQRLTSVTRQVDLGMPAPGSR